MQAIRKRFDYKRILCISLSTILASTIFVVAELVRAEEIPSVFANGIVSEFDLLKVNRTISFSSTTGDKISLYGNRIGTSSLYGFGVSSGVLNYKSNGSHRWYIKSASGSPRMHLTQTGLSIGTDDPIHELVIQGNDPAAQIRDGSGNNSTNAARLELLEHANGAYNGGAFFWWNGASNKLFIGTKENGNNQNVIVVDREGGNVGIGTQTIPADFRLAVNGAIRAKEIVVETGWADFVFEKGYNLRPLNDVERYIETHGHLPDLPSASKVAREGVRVGEMEAKLLQKIEELTLYMIDLKKNVEVLRQENAKLIRLKNEENNHG